MSACNDFPSVPRLATTHQWGDPQLDRYLVKLRDIWGIAWKLRSPYIFRQIVRRDRMCAAIVLRQDWSRRKMWNKSNIGNLQMDPPHFLCFWLSIVQQKQPLRDLFRGVFPLIRKALQSPFRLFAMCVRGAGSAWKGWGLVSTVNLPKDYILTCYGI